MNQIVRLTAQREGRTSYLELLASRAEDRVFTAEEQAEYDATKAAIDAIDRQIGVHREIEELRKSQAQPVTVAYGSLPRSKSNREKGIGFARMAIALAQAKGIPSVAAEIAENQMRDQEVAIAIKAAVTPVTTTSDTEIQAQIFLAGEFIELLRPMTVVGRLNLRRLSFDDSPSIRIPGLASGVAGAYIGEGGEIAVEKVVTREVVLTPKKLATIVPATAEILRRSTPALERIIRDDMLEGTARTVDAQFLHGVAASGVKDAGLLAKATADSNTTATAGATLANIITDLKVAVGKMRTNKIPMVAPTWIMSAEDAEALRWIRDGVEGFVFRGEMDAGRLSGYQLVTSQTVPTNLGTGTNESRLYLVDAAQVFFAEDMAPSVAMSDQATLKLDSDPTNSSTFTSLFQTDSVAFRLILGHSWGYRYDKLVHVTTAVNYAGRT